jgi:hypothetical protein
LADAYLVGDVVSLVAGEVALPDDVDEPASVGVVEVVGLTGPGVIPERVEPLVDPVAPGSEPAFVGGELDGVASVDAAALAEASDCMVLLEALASIA